MNYGSGWIVIEDKYPRTTSVLISIIAPRRSPHFVAQSIEQIYVDRYASIRERLNYKKSPKNFPDRTQIGLYSGVMHCGQDLVLHALQSDRIVLAGNELTFTYKILVREDPGHIPVFENRSQSVTVEVKRKQRVGNLF